MKKAYYPYLYAALLVLLALTVAFFITPSLQSPQARLNERIDEQIEKAQAMLSGYDPTDIGLVPDAKFAATQPGNQTLDPAKYPDYVNRSIRARGGYDLIINEAKYPDYLNRRAVLVAEALNIINQAVSLREGSGDETIGGDSHPAATRLEAIMYDNQADLLRRQAAVQRTHADAARTRLARWMGLWSEMDSKVRGVEAELTGKSAERVVVPTTKPATAKATPRAKSPTPAARPGAPGPGSQAQAPTKSTGLFKNLFNQMIGKGQRPPTLIAEQPEAPAPQQAPAPAAQPVVRTASAPPSASIQPGCTLSMSVDAIENRVNQTIAQRIADLQLCRLQVEGQIAEAQKQIETLTPAIQQLTEQSNAAKSRADAAQKQMLELEKKEVDATDPNSLKKFTTDYDAAAKTFRKASREANILEFGASATPVLTDKEKEVLNEPVIPVDPALQSDQRGLIAQQGDLRAAQTSLKTQQALIAQIDQQLNKLDKRQKEQSERLAKLTEARSTLTKEATEAAKAAVAATLEADKLEAEAIDLINTRGKPAAQRAKTAADSWTNNARDLQRPDSPNPRLVMMASDRFMAGHAKSVDADLDYELALIGAQRSNDLERHQRMLETYQSLGIPGEQLLPQGVTKSDANASAIQPDAAQKAADTARADAIKAAEAALESYKSADNDVKSLWVLHTNIAAIHYLLAGLTTDPDAEKNLTDARKEYERAIRDRRDRPEAKEYQRIIDGLSQRTK